MPLIRRRRALLALVFVLSIQLSASAGEVAPKAAAPGMPEAWRLLAAGDAAEAATVFARSRDREARVGHGIALLAVQPRTAAGLEQARRFFESVTTEPVRDDWSVLAEYMLARWHQLHAIEPDAQEGERRLVALLDEHAGHPWADAAAPKLVIAWLGPDLEEAEFSRRLERLGELLKRLRDPGAVRDTRLAMADAILRRGSDHARALPHYRTLAAEAEALRPSLRARVLFQVAESAAALGLREEAAAGWGRFVGEFPNDYRTGEARRRAQEILSR